MLSMFMMSDMFRCCAAAAASVVVVFAVVAAVDTSACLRLRCLICLPDFSFAISARAYVFSVYVMYVISSM